MFRPAIRHPDGFTLIELLIVVAIIAMLAAVLLAALDRARQQARRVSCLANLHAIATGLTAYIHSNRDHLPFVVEPLWATFTTDGQLNWAAEPEEADSAGNKRYPHSFFVLMKRYLRDREVMHCSSASLGMPSAHPWMTYRVSAANNYDGRSLIIEQLGLSDGAVRYEYSLKYLNGRPYVLRHVNTNDIPWKLAAGAGPYYLVRDFIDKVNGGYAPPHNRGFNQLFLDMHVERLTHPDTFSYP